MDRLDALRLFVRAAERLSFSKAAAEAGVRQSTVSKAIASLEARWGVALFLRSTRRIALTETGQRALARARAALETVAQLDDELTGRDHEPNGALRVHASVALARYVLAPIAVEFVTQFPHVLVDFLAGDERVELVEAGVDIAFELGPLRDSSYLAKRLGNFDLILAAAPLFISAHAPIAHPRDLEGMPCLVLSSALDAETWRLSNGTRSESVKITGPLKANSGGIIHEAVVRGAGLAFVPSFLIRADLEAGRLLHVLPGWRGEAVVVSAVWPPGRRLPAKARVFMDFVATQLNKGR